MQIVTFLMKHIRVRIIPFDMVVAIYIFRYYLGGYYSTLIKPGLRLIGLNTVIYYPPDILVKNGTDPDGQLKWLDTALQQAKEKAEKVSYNHPIPPNTHTHTHTHTYTNTYTSEEA